MPKLFSSPGPRAIHPSAATSSSLAATDPMAQLLFDRLIAAADDQGRLLGDLTLVKAACMPLIKIATLRRIAGWLDDLESHGMIQRYDAGTDQQLHLIQLQNWWDYQTQRHIWASRWPPPPGWNQDQIKGHGAETGRPTNGHAADNGRPTGGPSAAEKRPSGAPPADSRRPLPRAPAQPSAGAGAGPGHAGAVGRPAAGAPDASPPHRTADAYRAHEQLTGKPPTQSQQAWIDDECKRYGRQTVVDAMYDTPKPTERGWMNRVKDRLRGKAPPGDDIDWSPAGAASG